MSCCTATYQASPIDILDHKDKTPTIHTQPRSPIRLHRQQVLSGSPNSISSSASSSSDDLSLNLHHPLTPPTPISISSHIHDNNSKPRLAGSKQDEYLRIIEPHPVYPPDYSSLPPGGCPRFPVSSVLGPSDHVAATLTSNSVFDFFASPSASASATSDKFLGFTPPSLPPPAYSPTVYKIGVVARKLEFANPYEPATNRLWKYQIIEINSTQVNFYSIPTVLENQVLNFRPSILHQILSKSSRAINSPFTTQNDIQFYTFLKLLGLLHARLIRSYSLQHAKIGLASDYKKRENVLRVRFENEQMLLAFDNTQDIIDWNLGICVGKDVALDLDCRELPKYRTIPRRRRRRRDRENNTEQESVATIVTRLRSSSDPIRGGFSRLKNKLSRSSNLKNEIAAPTATSRINRSESNPVLPVPTEEEEEEYGEADEEVVNECVDQGQEDVQDISELQQSDDEEEDEDEDNSDGSSRLLRNQYALNYCSDSEYKWNPLPDKPFTVKRYYRQCLRCIRPLKMDEPWMSDSIVIASSTQPLAGVKTPLKLKKRVSADLEKVPDHFLQVYHVSPDGLVAC